MKKNLFLLLFLCGFWVGAQQIKKVSINWEQVGASLASDATTHASASLAAANDNEELLRLTLGAAPMYAIHWEEAQYVDPTSVRVVNVNYGMLTPKEMEAIAPDKIPAALEYALGNSEARDNYFTEFRISPVIGSPGNYRKVESFEIHYQYGSVARRMDPPAITNSVLAQGNWFKFKVEKTGVYKIDKSFLSQLGMNVNSIDPRTLKIYSHGGRSLPLLNSENIHFDLPENAIQVVGEEDGKFDDNDYILFYGIGTEGYVLDNDSHINPYSDDSYYYITYGNTPGKRVQPMVEPSGTADQVITTFTDYQFHEKDEESPTKLGRVWYGNRFDINREQNFAFNFPHIVAGSPMNVTIKSAAASESQTSLMVNINNTSQPVINYSPITTRQILNTNVYRQNITATTPEVNLKLTYNNSGNPSSVAYLDYIRIEAERHLRGVDGQQLAFGVTNLENFGNGINEYQLTNASQFTQIWDVTDPTYIVSLSNNNVSETIIFKQNAAHTKKFVAINPNDYYTPIRIHNSRVSNQNIKGTVFRDESGNFQDVDYLIITHPILIQSALKLANFHKRTHNLNVKVVTTDKIYEEFSSGKQDIGAIRNLVRYVYYNASEPSKRLKYIGIIGDTSIDYKDRLANNNNIVPTFHTVSHTDEANSFMSDDFFGNMGPDEGTIGGHSYDKYGNKMTDIDRLDIAVGRIIADNVSDANAMIDKIIHYATEASYGNWRTNFVLVSDDVDYASERELQKSLDELGDEISEKKPYINVKKIHTDAYQQQTSAGGNRYPEVNEAIKSAFDVGAIVINYFGHGGEDGLAHEAIYTKENAQELRNINNLPCMITVTCEFTKFDNPLRITAGELTYLNPEGGAISLVTTTRAVFISVGIEFNKALAPYMFGYDRDVPMVPAEALRLAKNDVSSHNRRAIFYIGDPALPLAFPKQDIAITKMNDIPIEETTDTIQALSRIKFDGEIRTLHGQLIPDYNGILEVKVFDKNVMRRTLDNDNNNVYLDFVTLGESVFNGKASIVNGRFSFEFVAPRDIQIPVGKGRISLYAKRDGVLEDQTGVNQEVRIGGLNKNAPEDTEGPEIKLYMNDESFVSGGITNSSPTLIAKLYDENGINTSSGIGHDLVAIIDGDESNPIVLNEFYQTEVDDFTNGTASYKLNDLSEGIHTLTLKAWDVYNNSSTAEIQFVVAGNDKLEITRVLNYPNPFVNYTEFWFNHNRPHEPLDVQVQIFTVSGKVVWTKNQTIITDGFLARDITWDGRDDFGDRIGKGVYVYKLTVKSTLTNQRVEKFEKLVIL
ncbi:MAG: type IX secretion system sortase PorU [Bacteroidetes bacterium]|jgi:hypothetical protein|nr:type IX secretion system sortase PorU [Bacteroidota bacterium]